ncbi:hypothetical protein C2G38_2076214 [Gigaspora rosea]|uniref:Uncharacterized protein n=1 Tax=Gigaspora rosea TaxID=44941 RepID=A0A397VLH6_9GLOM|nr:hypothetical protein C2G38_2076214 [Gigaspora rosea]
MKLHVYIILFIIFIVCSTVSAAPAVDRNKHRETPIVNHQEKTTPTVFAVKTPVETPVNTPFRTPVIISESPQDEHPCHYWCFSMPN